MNGENGTQMQNQAPQQSQQSLESAPNQMPAQNQPLPTSHGDEFSDLKRLAAAGAERMLRSGVNDGSQGSGNNFEQSQTSEANGSNLGLPAGLVDNSVAHGSPASQSNQSRQQVPGQQTTPQQQPENAGENQGNDQQTDQAEQQAKEISKIVLRNAQGQTMEFENDQLLQVVEGFHHYSSQIQNIQNDFNQRYQALETEKQSIEAEKAKIDALMNSEKGFLLQALESNQEFADKVASLLSDNPDLLAQYQGRKVDNVANQGQNRISEIEQKLENFLQSFQQQQEQERLRIQQQQQQQFVDQTVSTVQNNVAQLNQQYKVPDKILNSLTAQAVQEVQTGRLQFDPRTITTWFENNLKAISLELSQIKDQTRGEYLQQKQTAAPPPPTGGGTPSPANNTPQTPGERVRTVASLLQQRLNGQPIR